MDLQGGKDNDLYHDKKMGSINFTEVSPGVFETTRDPVLVSSEDVESLIRAAKLTPRGRARLLLHGDRADNLHEMVIALPSDSCDHPHINFKSGKSFLALAGRFAVLCFSDDGTEITAHVLAGDERWAGARILRLRKPVWHTVIPLDGDTVFLETIIGPFEGNKFAAWFPSDENAAKSGWIERLRQSAHAAKLSC
jgi:cupin fold WbuC family metalloprotein